MRNTRTKRFLVLFLAVILVPLAPTSVAYPEGALATLHANPASTPADAEVWLTGTGYSDHPLSSNISIRLDRRSGKEIHNFTQRETIAAYITIPAGTDVGEHILIATQAGADGAHHPRHAGAGGAEY